MNFFDLYFCFIEEYFIGYDDRVILMSRNSFMVVVFWFGYSLVNDYFVFKDCVGNKERILFLYFWGNFDKLYEVNGIEKILCGF